MIGCACAVCTSDDPRDRRTRASVVVSYPDASQTDEPDAGVRRILIDTTPELRMQITRESIHRVDAVLYTHAHADHIFGLDDLRRFNVVMQRPVDIYAEPPVLEQFRGMFRYIFEPHKNVNDSFIPQLLAQPLEPDALLDLHGARVTPLRVMHGRLPILGFRIDRGDSSIAYCTDVSRIPPETYPQLAGLDVLVLDALRYRHHPTHMTIEQALDVIGELRPKQAFLTHMSHDVMHAELDPKLPAGVKLSYDGLRVSV